MDDHAPRILGGALKGRRLHVARGRTTRPLKVMARRSLFDSLQARIPDSSVLDLFAGAGTIGFEAASRGARRVVLVEAARPALAALAESQHEFALESVVTIVAGDAMQFVTNASERFDFVYVGPPYPLFRGESRPDLLAMLRRLPALLAESGLLVIETPAAERAPELAIPLARSREFGESTLHFYS